MKNRTRIFTWTLVYLAWLLISITSNIIVDNSSEKTSEKAEWVNDQPEEGDSAPIALESQASGNLNENESPKPASTVIFTEDFDNGGSIPSGWETGSALAYEFPWRMKLDKGSDYSAECNSFEAGSGHIIIEVLYTKDYIDCSGYTSLELEFYMHYKYGNGNEYAQVRVISEGGVVDHTWNLEDVEGTQIIDLSYAAGDSEVRIAFRYKGSYDYWMIVDDVILRGEEQDDDDDDDDDDGNGNGHKKSDNGIDGGVVNFLLSPIGLIIVGGITVALVAIVIVVWVVKKKYRR
ncbi:MAG: hypothetical protein ACFFAN_01925 [Promethearchaeota archaeon]